MIHKFKPKPGYEFSGPCKVCGYTNSNEIQHGHSCTGKVIESTIFPGKAYCYGCGKQYEVSNISAFVKAR
jgi:hypothetical protein